MKWDLDQKRKVPDAVKTDDEDSEMSSLSYGKFNSFHLLSTKELTSRWIWMMASHSQCHKYFGW